ncbi:MAG: hypothetical protein WA974_18270, partial [Thermodesulfobacteriota bacterium]
TLDSELGLKMILEVILHAVVIEQGVVQVKKEHHFTGGYHPITIPGLQPIIHGLSVRLFPSKPLIENQE